MAYDVFDYALPGASAYEGGVSPDFVDLEAQVDAWIADPPASRLTVIYIGYNDIRTFGTLTTPLAHYATQIDRLITAGATATGKYIVLALVHDFGSIPAGESAWTTRTPIWNTGVADLADARTNVVVVDLFTPFEDIFANPALYGFTNVTDSASGDVAGWLHADDYHFGSQGQELIALVFDYCLRQRWDLTEAGNAQATLNGLVIDYLRANSTPIEGPEEVVFTRVRHADSGHWSGTTVTATFGATPAEGNLLVATAFCRSQVSGAPSMPSGWVERAWRFTGNWLANDRRGMAVFTKVAGASEPTGVTATWDASVGSRMNMHEFNADDPNYAWQFLQAAIADSGTGATGSGSGQMEGTTDSPVGPFTVGDATPGDQSLCRIGLLAGRTYDDQVPGAAFAAASGGVIEAAGAAFQTAWACGFLADDEGGTGLTETTSWTNAQLQVSTVALIFGGASAST